MQIEKIYFDMDGVLADFDRGILEFGHFAIDRQGESNEEQDRMIWDVVREVDHFYDKLLPVEGALELFCEMRKKYGDKCEILSAVPKPYRGIPTAREDKISWVRRLIGEDVVINLVYRAEKQDFAKNKNCVLVDDYEINITEWENAGGTGVFFVNAEDARRRIMALE